MKKFTIQPNECLTIPIEAWCNSDYYGGCGRHTIQGTIENIICVLKNDFGSRTSRELNAAAIALHDLILPDLANIKASKGYNLVVSTVPRAKVYNDSKYLNFKTTVKQVVQELDLTDGTDYILRHTDTQTTHNARQVEGGNGNFPHEGITKETCNFSGDIEGKTILLIDDVYTPDVNIDEDAIQALLDKGAARVLFYAVGKTVRN